MHIDRGASWNPGAMGARVALVLLLVLSSCDDDGAPADLTTSLDMAAAQDLSVTDLAVPTLPVPDLMPPACIPPAIYPAPPYGYRAGRVIEDLAFQGKHDADLSGRVDSNDPVTTLSLHDYHQDPNTKLLVIVACAMWCAPCVAEQPSLNTMSTSYEASGVAFLSVILQNPSSGPSTIPNLNNWGAAKNVPYDLAIDPTELLGPYFPIQAFPMQMLIRTRDMRILWLDNGADPARLQAQIDAALDGDTDGGTPPPPPMACDLGGTSPTDGGVLSFCDSCVSDGDCASGYVCANDTIGGHFCARPCAVAEDCPQNAPGYPPFEDCVNDSGGKGMVCRPVGGACHGSGVVCDWCRPGVPSDCAGGTSCITVPFSGERFCSQACTVQADLDTMTNTWSYSGDSCPSGSICTVGQPTCGSSCTLNGLCANDPKRLQLTCNAPTP
jgi:thiol-disulfide isomerase/thioredoxin